MAYRFNFSSKSPRLSFSKTSFNQKGAALIFMAFILGLGAAVYVLKTYNSDNAKVRQDEKTSQALNEAKVALIAWSVNHSSTPGQMPWPDRNGDGNYDGSSDCVVGAGTFQYSLLLGQLPSLPTTSPCLDPNNGLTVYAGLSTYPSLGQDFRDAQGNRLWYAVSRNLVRDYEHSEDPVINSGMINSPHAITPYLRQGGTESYPWLKVLDRNGNLVSDRVAAVIIAPGNPLGAQNRSAAAPNAAEFLDSFQIGATVYNNSSYSLPNEDFVMGEDSRNVPLSDTTFVKPYNFNDKLVYITIDELMAALEKRVGEQVRSSLKTYRNTNGYYPYASQLGSVLNFSGEQNAAGTSGLSSGFLPANYQSCNYAATDATHSSISCIQPIFDAAASSITQIRFYGSSAFTAASSGCTISGSNRCYCTGTGSCSNATMTFSCNLNNCSAIGSGATGDIRIRGGKLTFSSGGCVHTTFPTKNALGCSDTTTSRITCNSMNGSVASNGDARFDTLLPAWFNQNMWGSYMYYQMTRPASSTIAVGSRVAEAVVVTAGRPIDSIPFSVKGAAQTPPSCNAINEYLDSTENTNGDAIYEPTSKLRAGNYNDQTFTVSP